MAARRTRREARDGDATEGDAPLLAGRYRYDGELGRGATSRVLALSDAAGARLVAKVLDREAGVRAMWELDALSSVESPHLARVLELLRSSTAVGPPFSIARGAWVLVQARAEGDESSEVLARLEPGERGERLVALVAGVARALAALHARGLSHGDVKPENVIVQGDHAVLVDLGAAAPFGRGPTVSGTPAYMAPEAREGERSVATDLYGLGATLVAWASGAPPVPGEWPALAAWVPPGLVALARELTSDTIGERPRDAEDVVARLVPGTRRSSARSLARPPLVGADEAVARLLALLDARGWARVVGPRGSGRSRLVEETARALQRREAEAGREVPTYHRGEALPWGLAASALVHVEGGTIGPDAIERFVSAGRLAGLVHRVVVECADAEGDPAVHLSPLSSDELRSLVLAVRGDPPAPAALAAIQDATGRLAGRVVRAIGAITSAGLDPLRAADWRSARWLADDERPWPQSTVTLIELASALGGRLAIEGPWDDPVLAEGARWAVREGLASIDPSGTLTVRRDLGVPLDDTRLARAITRARELALTGLARAVWMSRSGAADEAVALALSLAEQARSQGSPEDAADALERFLAHGLVPDGCREALTHALADAHRASGDLVSAERVLAGASHPTLTLLRGETLRLAGRTDEAREVARALTASADPGVAAQAHALAARSALAVEPRSAREHADAIDAIASPAAAARGAETQALGALAAGEVQSAQAWARDGRRHADAIADAASRRAASARLASVEAQALAAAGRLAEARERHAESGRLAAAAGERLLEATCSVNVGLASLEDGEWGEALTALESGARLLARLGRTRELARATANLANVACLIGDDARARAACEEAVGPCASSGDREAAALVAIVRSELAVRQGKLRGASAALEAVRDRAGALEPIVGARLVATRALTGDVEGAEAALRSIGPAARAEPRVDVEHALAELRLASASGDRERGSRALDRARTRLRSGEVGLELRVRTHALELEQAEVRGDRPAAHAALRELRALLEPVLRGLPPSLHSRFRQIPTHRRALSEGVLVDEAPGERPAEVALAALAALGREPRLGALLERLAGTALELASAERAFVVEWTRSGPEVRARAGAARGDPSARPSSALVARALREGLVVSSDAVTEHDASGSVHALSLRSVLAAALPRASRSGARLAVIVDDRLRASAFGPGVAETLRHVVEIAGPLVAARHEAHRARRAERDALRREETLRADDERRRALLEDLGGSDDAFSELVRDSPASARLIAEARKLAPSDLSILLVGETGVGKDVLARAIHRASARRHGPFVAERAQLLVGPLSEARLFGHVRGAFTGAEGAQKGLFELAHRGTLYLDGIDDLTPDAQARLLRVLVDGEVRPLGAARGRRVDVRVLAAIQRPPEAAIAAGTLREDLYYRLAGAILLLPPLRERPEDLDVLIDRAVARSGRPMRLTTRAREALHARRWPGNVRELEHVIAHALLSCHGSTLDVDDLGTAPGSEPAAAPSLHARRDALTRELVLATLEAHRGNRTHAARALGLSRFGLQKLLKRLHAS